MDALKPGPTEAGADLPDEPIALGEVPLRPQRVVRWVLDNVPPPPNPPAPVPAVQ